MAQTALEHRREVWSKGVRKVTVTKVKKFCVKESRFLRLQKKNNPKKHLIDVFSSYIMTAPQMQNWKHLLWPQVS